MSHVVHVVAAQYKFVRSNRGSEPLCEISILIKESNKYRRKCGEWTKRKKLSAAFLGCSLLFFQLSS